MGKSQIRVVTREIGVRNWDKSEWSVQLTELKASHDASSLSCYKGLQFQLPTHHGQHRIESCMD
jgi:hypothetical protein